MDRADSGGDGRQDGADGTACYTDGREGADGGACDPADEWRWPLVVAGGPCACNPEPLADFIDMFFIGDGEELLPQVMRLYREARQKGWSRQTFYRQACRLPGVYIPALYAVDYHEDGTVRKFCKLVEEAPLPVRRAIAEDLAAQTFPTDPVVPLVAAVHDRSVVEIFRGCTRGCRFCQAGMIYRPVRERPAAQIISLAMEQLENTGNDELSLLSLSSSDHTQFEPLALGLMEQCSARHVALSLPSLRVDRSTVHVLERMQSFKKSGLTYAPEAGTQRLRDVINKGVTEADIFSSLSEAVALGWRHVKLYFMIGLPTEGQEDLDGIADLAGRIAALSRSFHVNVSVSNFVPKPHTPFQWVGQDSAQTFAEKHAYLHQRLAKVKGVTFRYHDSKTSLYEAVLARGDRRLGEVLLRAYRLGCRLDSWSEHFRADLWERAFAESGLTTDFYATRTRAMDEVLPWDLIDCGVSKSFLMEEMEKAQSAVTTPDCRTGGCTGCGVRRFAACPAARVKEAD